VSRSHFLPAVPVIPPEAPIPAGIKARDLARPVSSPEQFQLSPPFLSEPPLSNYRKRSTSCGQIRGSNVVVRRKVTEN
jgi:hypothetical protein